ncbi:MAG: endo-1,4-beta-xylanase [Planctomycetia bacterium]|nr:endo-1,4-beta-xylanase [Planctomycetia bacterium]
MHRIPVFLSLIFFAFAVPAFSGSDPVEIPKDVMSEKYWSIWNESVQKKIDADIEKYRKTNAEVVLEKIKPGTSVKVEQLTHSFKFGSNIFLFGMLDSDQKNKIYADAFGELFNAATIAFYWKTLEPEQGKPRYTADCKPIWRRPPTDPVVDYCESRGVDIHGHAIIYAFPRWGHPDWLPKERKAMEPFFEAHIRELAQRYGSRISEWDVVNESYDQASRGPVPDDYVYKTFKWCEKYFPKTVKFSTNECDLSWGPTPRYTQIARDLVDRGVRVDLMGVQAHLYSPKECAAIAQGAKIRTPDQINAILACMSEANLPIHISEITISAPSDDEKGRNIQAIIAKNLYRLWFSHPNICRITWWNAVDGGAVPNEPSTSGIFTKDLQKKPVYHVLDDLINKQWRTNLTVKPVDGKISFRGFRGKYRITWTDTEGTPKSKEIELKD